MKERREVQIRGGMIRLGQLLKLAGVVDAGGELRWYLADNPVLVNGEQETRRGRQLHPGETVETDEAVLVIVAEPD